LKIRHILLLLLAVLAIAFMQPLVSFLGGLTLLLGVGGLIFRDLSPANQDAMERRLLAWLRRARATGSPPTTPKQINVHQRLPADPAESVAVEPPRRSRIKSPTRRPAGDAAGDNSPPVV
jgi:hypothetical protein